MSLLEGKVLKSTGKWYLVLMPDNSILECRIRGKLRMDGLKTTNPIAVGDTVFIDPKFDEEGKAVIVDFKLRENYIVRKSTNLSKQMHILAANIDRAYLLVTIKHPETHCVFIDRFLVAAESFRIPVTLIFNKIDLLQSEKDQFIFEETKSIYESVNYPCHAISALDSDSIAFLREEIKGKQVMIAGHSGTGKSTLVNALDSNLNLRTGEISSAHFQGQHTTTFAEMHPLKTGGFIIDTPGIRAFGIVDLEKEVISHYFPEMRELMHQCKFHNCQHLNEPKCAIKDAIESERIHPSRYNSYLQIISEDSTDVHRRNARNN